ncbi:MAG: hypothetical protein ACREVL_10165, partial [Solimonas sp.]
AGGNSMGLLALYVFLFILVVGIGGGLLFPWLTSMTGIPILSTLLNGMAWAGGIIVIARKAKQEFGGDKGKTD